MTVISRRVLREFARRHPEASGPLAHWANSTEAAEWRSPGDLTVFDVGGKKYRVIVFVHYRRKIAYIKGVLTHRECDKGGWRR